MGWEDARFTQAGIELIRRCADTGAGVRISGVKACAEVWPSAALANVTTLAGEVKQELPVAQVDDGEHWKRLTLQVTPMDLAEGYQLRQIGIWGRGNASETPVLMFIMQDEEGFAIPSAEEMPWFSLTISAVLEIDDPGGLTIERECWIVPADKSVSRRKLAPDLETALLRKDLVARVAFLHEEPENCASASAGFGLCCVMWDSRTCIVNDFGASADGSTLVNFLHEQGIGKVDAVIVSHYHDDHIRMVSLNALLDSDIDLSECTFYLPHRGVDPAGGGIDLDSFVGDSAAWIGTIHDNVTAALDGAGIDWIEPDAEGYAAEAGDFSLTFYNVSPEHYAEYYAYTWFSHGGNDTGSTRYNNFSLCANVNIGGVNIFLSGDIEEAAQNHMAPYVSKADVFLVPHHGRNLHESRTLAASLTCRIGVIPQYFNLDGGTTEGTLALTAGRCRDLGALLSTINRTVTLVLCGGGVFADTTDNVQLGACLGNILRQGTDFDDLDFGDYFCSQLADLPTFVHAPDNIASLNSTFTLHVEPLNNNTTSDARISQRITVRPGAYRGSVTFSRMKLKSASPWTPWRNDMAPLLHEAEDVNALVYTGLYIAQKTAANRPAGLEFGGFVLVYEYVSGGRRLGTQLYLTLGLNEASAYMRVFGQSGDSYSFSSWVNLGGQ